jgi:hypothetical protein
MINKKTFKENNIKNEISKLPASSIIKEDDFICRICYDTEKNNKNMIFPCKCKGTMKWVHLECLEKWIRISKKKICGSCKYNYKMKRISLYPKLEIFDNYRVKKYISISILFILLLSSCYFSYNFLGKNKLHNSNVLYFFDGLKLLTFTSFFLIAIFHYFEIYNIDSILDNISYYNGINSIYDILYILYQIINKITSQIIESKLSYNYIIDNYLLETN